MADIFEQVDDALRQDRMRTLWRRYGWMVIAAAILIVVGTAAVVGWREYERGVAEEQTNALTAAVTAAVGAEPAEAVTGLTTFAESAEPDMAALARMYAAGRALGADDRATAIALYRTVAETAEVDPALRDLATVLAASLSVDTTDLDTLRTSLASLDASNSPWRYLTGEIIVAAAIRAGDLALARERLTAIVDDPEAPISLRGRAAEVLAALGGDPEQPADDAEPVEAPPDPVDPAGANDDAPAGEEPPADEPVP